MKRLTLNDWMPMSWINILPSTLSLIAVGVFIIATGHYFWSVALFLGVIAGSLVDVDHHFRGRLRYMLWVIPAFVVVSVSIEALRNMPVLLILFMTTLAFCMTYLGALDARYRTIAFGTLVAALYTLLIYQPQLPFYVNPILILCGTLLYQIIALVIQAIMPNRPVQMNLALSYRALSEFIAAKADFFDPDEIHNIEDMQHRLASQNQAVIAAFNDCREALFRRLEGERTSAATRRQLRDYVIAQDIHERLSSSHIDYREFAARWAYSDVIFRLQRMIRLQAQTCARMADTLEQGYKQSRGQHQTHDQTHDQTQHQRSSLQPTGRLTRAMVGIEKSLQNQIIKDDERVAITRLIHNLEQVNDQIRTLTKPHEPDFQRDIASAEVKGFQRAKALLSANFTLKSRYFRHALRMGLLTLIISVTVELFDLTFGYWILLTTVFVVQPNFSATKYRLRHRITGTILGVLFGSLIALMQPDAIIQIAFIVIANINFFYFVRKSYSLSTMFITIQALIGFSLLGIHVDATLWPRLLYTCIGSALAWWAVVFCWPDWRYFALGQTVHDALTSASAYFAAIMDEFASPSTQDVAYRSARRRAHERATELSKLVHEMALFPERFQAEIPLSNQLLSQHFRLLSDLSALGAARETASELDAAHLQRYLSQGRALSQIIATLDCTPQHPPTLSQSDEAVLHERSADLLAQQFARINQRVDELSALLSKLGSADCRHFEPIKK